MCENSKLPDNLTPLNIMAYLHNGFGLCGCSEVGPVRDTLIKLMEWQDSSDEGRYESRPPHQEVFKDVGVFYLLQGSLDRLGLSGHGTSVRIPWLTKDGKRLLDALKATSEEEIDNASGEAYDGCWWGAW